MLSVQCLGVGRGGTNFSSGEPSTAFVLKRDSVPYLLLDLGAGVAVSAKRLLGGNLPALVYISHNHSDHTGDLPVFIAGKGPNEVSVLGHPDVQDIVRSHRLHELPSVGVDPIQEVNWLPSDPLNNIFLDDLQFQLFQTKHRYLCYGFVLLYQSVPIFGWTADSPFCEDVYETVARAPIVIAHGRDRPEGDHAALDEIDAFAIKKPETRFFVSHYGASSFAFDAKNASLMTVGQEVRLV